MHLFHRFFQVAFGKNLPPDKVPEYPPATIRLWFHQVIVIVNLEFIVASRVDEVVDIDYGYSGRLWS
jgi:hypothetical protein